MRSLPLVAAFLLAMPLANAHGDLAINELETLAIRDFEGMEDSFPWEGFEIWDVYVGEGYNESYAADGVYFKVNFAGDGTERPLGGKIWSLTFTFAVGEEAFEREIIHDGTEVRTSFESLEWMIADGNVFQVKAWTPVANATGKSVTDIVIVSAVDGEMRDRAPGGVFAPGAQQEMDIQAPGTPIFPPLGEGRIVQEILLTGPEKFLDVSLALMGEERFALTVTNPLKEQGQHVSLHAGPAVAWNVTSAEWATSLDAGASTVFDVAFRTLGEPGAIIPPLRVDLLSDIGGRQTHYAFSDAAGIHLVKDESAAQAGVVEGAQKDAPGLAFVGLLVALAVGGVARASTRRK